jgi:hypothetical protein
MKNNISRIMLCFAALDLPDHELFRLISELRSMPWEAISAQVTYLRRLTRHPAVYEDMIQQSAKKYPNQPHDGSVGERVERLLKIEARMTTAQAVEQLSEYLVAMGLLQPGEIPLLSRKSLRDWVTRIGRRVPAKDILRCATVIRNEHVHSPVRDWTLSGPKTK